MVKKQSPSAGDGRIPRSELRRNVGMGVAVGKDQVCSRRGSSVGGEEGSCAVRGGECEGRELSLGEERAGKKSRVGCVSELLRARMTVCLG